MEAIAKNQQYRHKKLPNVKMTIIMTHVVMHSHWLGRIYAGEDHIADGYVHEKDIAAEWELVFSPAAKDLPQTAGAGSGG